jgi:hypothetical protein
MKCTESVTKFDKAAGRELTTCKKFDGPADGELGTFAFAPSGLHWAWGAGAGAAVSLIGGQLGASGLFGKVMSADGVNYTPADDAAKAKWAAILGAGLPTATGVVMAIFRGTRTAGWAMIGTGLALGTVQYFAASKGKYLLNLGLSGDLAGMIAARQQMMGAGSGGVQILGLPVAKEIKGAGGGGIQIMGGTDGGAEPPVQVLQGGFGTSFGTNFASQ